MDPLSHGLLGAVYASAFNQKRAQVRLAALCGMVGALAPDADIVIRSASNPLLSLEFHRHFTHALIFAPVGALAVAGWLWLLLRRHMSFAAIYFFTCLGMLTHGMLDSMTNYGTHLFWPFTNARESWSIISIIDPIFTLTLLLCLLLTLVRRSKIPVMIGLIFCLCYWSFGLSQRDRATQEMFALASARGHMPERFEVKPSFANLLVWRTQYAMRGTAYIDAVRVTPLSSATYYGGSTVALYSAPGSLPPRQARDVAFFTFFSDGWVAQHPDRPTEIGDIRFALLPYQTGPLWAIRLKPDHHNAHVDFISTRNRKPGDFAKLWHMIQGHEP